MLAKEPVCDDGTLMMVRAFAELSTCRHLGMGMHGPIPWTAMVEWCHFRGLDYEVSLHVISVLRFVDAEIMRRQAAEIRASSKGGASK